MRDIQSNLNKNSSFSRSTRISVAPTRLAASRSALTFPGRHAVYEETNAFGRNTENARSRTLAAISIFFLVSIFTVGMGWIIFSEQKKIDPEATLDKEFSKFRVAEETENAQAKVTKSSSASAVSSTQPKTQPVKTSPPAQTDSSLASQSEIPESNSEAEKLEEKLEEYSSAVLKVSLQYPVGFEIKETAQEVSLKKDAKDVTFKIYNTKEKANFEEWFLSNYGKKDNADCEYLDSVTIKVGTYQTKQVKLKAGGVKCEDADYFAFDSEKTKVARVIVSSETDEENTKILNSFKFLE